MKKIIEHINWLAFLVLLAVMPYPMQFIRFFWIVWLVSWLLEFRFLRKPKIEVKTLVPFIGMAIWFILSSLSSLWSPNKEVAIGMIGRYVNVLFLLPLVIWGVNEEYDIKKCMKVIVIASSVSILVYLFTHYWVFNMPHAHDRRLPVTYNIDFLHLSNLLLAIKHRMHFTNFLCMAVLSVLYLVPDWKNKYGKWHGIVLSVLTIIWLSIGIYWTGSRLGLINLILVIALFFIVSLKGTKRIIGICSAFVLVVVGAVVLFTTHPRFKAIKPSYVLNYASEETVNYPKEPRMAIWKIIIMNRDQYPLYGMGIGTSEEFLTKEYAKYDFLKEYERKHYSPHNEFLAMWMELGIIAAILFFVFWITIPLFYKKSEARHFALCFMVVALSAMLTDHLLLGLEGLIFVSVFLFFPMLFPDEKEDIAQQEQSLGEKE